MSLYHAIEYALRNNPKAVKLRDYRTVLMSMPVPMIREWNSLHLPDEILQGPHIADVLVEAQSYGRRIPGTPGSSFGQLTLCPQNSIND